MSRWTARDMQDEILQTLGKEDATISWIYQNRAGFTTKYFLRVENGEISTAAALESTVLSDELNWINWDNLNGNQQHATFLNVTGGKCPFKFEESPTPDEEAPAPVEKAPAPAKKAPALGSYAAAAYPGRDLGFVKGELLEAQRAYDDYNNQQGELTEQDLHNIEEYNAEIALQGEEDLAQVLYDFGQQVFYIQDLEQSNAELFAALSEKDKEIAELKVKLSFAKDLLKRE